MAKQLLKFLHYEDITQARYTDIPPHTVVPSGVTTTTMMLKCGTSQWRRVLALGPPGDQMYFIKAKPVDPLDGEFLDEACLRRVKFLAETPTKVTP